MNDLNDPTIGGAIGQWLGIGGVAVVGVFLTIQKLWKGWATDRAERVGDDLQTVIAVGQTKEIERLQTQNALLADELNKMQISVARIAGEAARMAAENVHLRAEIEQLQSQIANLIEQITSGAPHGRAEPV